MNMTKCSLLDAKVNSCNKLLLHNNDNKYIIPIERNIFKMFNVIYIINKKYNCK